MNEMIERVGNAIQLTMSIRAYGLYDYSSYPGDSPPHVVRNELTGNVVFRSNSRDAASNEYEKLCKDYLAKAAIKAMREPTEEMVDEWYKDNYGECVKGYQTMIDKALE